MSEPQQACATDKEIFDLLMGTKKRFTETALLDIAKSRGVFYSPKDDREMLASNISLLPHTSRSVLSLLAHREIASRSERVTHVTLSQEVDIEKIKEVTLAYKSEQHPGEEVECVQQGMHGYKMSVRYSEIDYSKTRLIQRREKEADIEFVVEGGQTTIRMPVNDKATAIGLDLKKRIEQSQAAKLVTSLIELSDVNDPQQRSEFFTTFIASMDGFRLRTVTSLKVEKHDNDDDPSDLDDDDDDHAAEEREMLAVVESVALKGQGLHTSTEYQEFRERGFYISSIIWRAEQEQPPHDLVEFEAGFDDPETCKVFRYKVRGVAHKVKDKHTKTLKPAEASERDIWLGVIEATAHAVLKGLRESVAEAGE